MQRLILNRIDESKQMVTEPTASVTPTAAQFTYDATHVHAVIDFDGSEYSYDGDGNMVKSTVNGITTYYVGGHYEYVQVVDGDDTITTETKYYSGPTGRYAMRVDTETVNGQVSTTTDELYWIFSDHLQSSSVILEEDGDTYSRTAYTAFGEDRYNVGTSPTDYGYTGQRSYTDDFGLNYFKARWQDPVTAHFVQADTIVPNSGNSGDWDRYAYVDNCPINKNDPTGHCGNDPYHPIYDAYCDQIAQEVSAQIAQTGGDYDQIYGSISELPVDVLNSYFNLFTDYWAFYDENFMPQDNYDQIQLFTAHQALLSSNGDITDLDALGNIVHFAYALGSNFKESLDLIGSAFYRPIMTDILLMTNVENREYSQLSGVLFGVTGFNDKYIDDDQNQVSHFLGEAAIFSRRAFGIQGLGNLGATYQDSGDSHNAIVDRDLGFLASYWVTNHKEVSISVIVNLISTGEDY